MATLAQWIGDLLTQLEDGHPPDLHELAGAAEGMLSQAEEQAAYYAEPGPPDAEPVRQQMAEMAELLAMTAELLGAYCDTENPELIREALLKAQELCDIRDSLHYELQGESDVDSQLSSY